MLLDEGEECGNWKTGTPSNMPDKYQEYDHVGSCIPGICLVYSWGSGIFGFGVPIFLPLLEIVSLTKSERNPGESPATTAASRPQRSTYPKGRYLPKTINCAL